MGLLAALDYYYETPDTSSEVEYRLLSWGEIYAPFLGDREHSINAQFILREFPFKLFSISTAYSEIPQKICLTFKLSEKVIETKNMISPSYDPDEVANEFAAFLSVVTRRRVFAIGQTRSNGLPLETSAQIYNRSYAQERQQMIVIEPDDIYRLLRNLQSMDRHLAESYILAIRLYHSAIEQMYTEPEFAYVYLVMSIEAIASVFYNRLRLGRTLESCATIQFALGRHKDRLLYADLHVDSPYNTYTNKGLPPGPICSPGLASIKAALYPSKEQYLYFVARTDGSHVFSKTYEAHLRAKREIALGR